MGEVTFDNDARRLKLSSCFHAATPFCMGRPRLWGGDTTTATLRHAIPAVGDNVVTNLLTTATMVIDGAAVVVNVAAVSVCGHRCRGLRRDVRHGDIMNDHRRACAAPMTATMYGWREHTTVVACRSIIVDAEVNAP